MLLWIVYVVLENILEIPRGGVQKDTISEGVGWGWLLEVFFRGAPSKTGELSKTNSCSIEQAISYFTVNDL